MAAAASPPSPDPFDRLPPDCLLRVLIALKAQTLARFAVAVPVGFRVLVSETIICYCMLYYCCYGYNCYYCS